MKADTQPLRLRKRNCKGEWSLQICNRIAVETVTGLDESASNNNGSRNYDNNTENYNDR